MDSGGAFKKRAKSLSCPFWNQNSILDALKKRAVSCPFWNQNSILDALEKRAVSCPF
jgi:hypothetical protein